MEKFLIEGGRPLRGRLRVAGGKNSSLAIIAAAALAPDHSVLENVPRCRDVLTLLDILRALGVAADFTGPGRLELDARSMTDHVAPYELCRQMRASIYVAGMLLGRLGRAEVPLPGGCVIGSRPVDFHIRGFETLGAQVVTQHGFLKAYAPRLTPATFYVPRSSVGTTINMMLASSRIPGVTVLQNAAREPEIVDTAVLLSLLGVRVRAETGLRAVEVDTAPYPGFATDLHPQLAALLTMAAGRSAIRETIFEKRFGYADELRRMGADIRVEGDTVTMTGVPTLSGAP